MAKRAGKMRNRKAGASVLLAAALVVSSMLSVAQPTLATEQDEAIEQVADPTEESVEEPAEELAEKLADEPAEESAEEPTEDPTEVPAEELVEEPIEEPEPDIAPEPELEESVSKLLPPAANGSSYDPRTSEGTSAIRDQFWGTCWAQAGISTMESFLIHSGQESTSVQFSVEDMLWWVYQSNWYMPLRESSGYPPMATGYLTTVGVRSEADIPYFGKPADFKDGEDSRTSHPSNAYESGENQKPANYDTAPVLYEVTDMVFVRKPSQQEVKDLITKYGAVSTAYKMSEDYFDQAHSTDWGNGRFDESGEELSESNHAVSVVGWNDSFPKEWFAEQNGKRPEHDGAWILKNSFGTGYGSDGGFTYVSYDDEFIFRADQNPNLSYSYAVARARKPLEQKRYMHDTYGAVASWQPERASVSTWANVFDFGSGEKLNEVSFVSWSKGQSYELYYAPTNGYAPTGDESQWVSLAQGSIDYAGYHTVSVGWNDEVPEGKGAIILRVNGSNPSIGTEEFLTSVSGRPLYAMTAEAARGKGYMLQNGDFVEASIQRGTADAPVTEYPILCIRAYTVPCEKRGTPDDPVDPVGPDKPVTSDDPSKPADDKPATSSKPTGATKTSAPLPQTGDESGAAMGIMALAGVALIAVGALWDRRGFPPRVR